MGEWEASYNDTWPAIDLIPKDVFICDWHYERADLTAVYFALKGFPVATCGYRNPEVCLQQIRDQRQFRTQSAPETAARFQGYIHTIWSGAGFFLKRYYELKDEKPSPNGKGKKADGNGEEAEDRAGDVRALLAVIDAFSKQP